MTTPPTEASPSRSPPPPSASPARPCCSVSSAATSAPSTSAPDAGKACVSSYQPPKTACSSHPQAVKEQCDDQSTTGVTQHTAKTPAPSAPAACAPRPPRAVTRMTPCERITQEDFGLSPVTLADMRKLIVSNFLTLDGYYESTNKT